MNRQITFKLTGASHGEHVGIIANGLPKGQSIDLKRLQEYVNRRRAINNAHSTSRLEEDTIEFVSGISNGVLTGDTLEAVTYNKKQISSHYNNLLTIPRPSHADYPAIVKFGDDVDLRGGGKFSGRLTFGLCVLGGIAEQLIEKHDVKTGAYISEIGGILASTYKDKMPKYHDIIKLDSTFRVFDKRDIIIDLISKTKMKGDSLGGVIECIAYNVPAGLADTHMDSFESILSAILFAIPAVKGVEFGFGFDITQLLGSQANDEYYYDEDKQIKTYTNNNGGVLGGITTGMPIMVRVAIKPTASILREQNSIDLKTKENVKFTIHGRHDACIVPRAVVCVESAMNIALLETLLRR